MTGRAPGYVCPQCKVPVSPGRKRYSCASCKRDFPVLFGIPDFRIRPDRYLSIDEERAKAARLFAYGQDHSFVDLLRYYYEVTDDVPPQRAIVFAGYAVDAVGRAEGVLAELGPIGPGDALLDLGCGSGGALVAAASGGVETRVGVDIGLRWLVIAQKRLNEIGAEATLVCADVEALPFDGGGFSHAIAEDLLDHVRSPEAAFAEATAQLRPGGKLWITAANRWWAGPHPAVGIWSAGLLPRELLRRLTVWRHGVDMLRFTNFLSARDITRIAQRHGVDFIQARPRSIDPSLMQGRSRLVRTLARAYRTLGSMPGSRSLLLAAGPAFQIVLQRPRTRGDEG